MSTTTLRFDGAASRRRRYITGKSVAQVSGQISVSPSWIYRVERGEILPTPARYADLINALGLQPGDLLIEEEVTA